MKVSNFLNYTQNSQKKKKKFKQNKYKTQTLKPKP